MVVGVSLALPYLIHHQLALPLTVQLQPGRTRVEIADAAPIIVLAPHRTTVEVYYGEE